jgi:hypothetical protein
MLMADDTLDDIVCRKQSAVCSRVEVPRLRSALQHYTLLKKPLKLSLKKVSCYDVNNN